MTCWVIWIRRNKLCVNELVWPLERVASLAQQQPQEFQCLAKPKEEGLPEKTSVEATHGLKNWTRPIGLTGSIENQTPIWFDKNLKNR